MPKVCSYVPEIPIHSDWEFSEILFLFSHCESDRLATQKTHRTALITLEVARERGLDMRRDVTN